ncbi:hypothetical protein [Vibrio vulnificus]|uniref:hypothetical protein n=1 Tax=Vibrio vulnificus TaxID=672 RepID=UPI0032423822
MKNKDIAELCHTHMTSKNLKQDFYSNISDEQFEEIKKSITAETRIRNEKTYYRFENILTNEIEWCVESKLGTYLKSKSFKHHLKLLGKNRRADRNKNKNIYHTKNVKVEKPYKSVEELEEIFNLDLERGKSTQPFSLTERPTKLSKLQF